MCVRFLLTAHKTRFHPRHRFRASRDQIHRLCLRWTCLRTAARLSLSHNTSPPDQSEELTEVDPELLPQPQSSAWLAPHARPCSSYTYFIYPHRTHSAIRFSLYEQWTGYTGKRTTPSTCRRSMKRDSKEEALQVRRDARMIPFGLFSPGSGGGKRSNHSYGDSELHPSPF